MSSPNTKCKYFPRMTSDWGDKVAAQTTASGLWYQFSVQFLSLLVLWHVYQQHCSGFALLLEAEQGTSSTKVRWLKPLFIPFKLKGGLSRAMWQNERNGYVVMDTEHSHPTAMQEEFLVGEFRGIRSCFSIGSICLEGSKINLMHCRF